MKFRKQETWDGLRGEVETKHVGVGVIHRCDCDSRDIG